MQQIRIAQQDGTVPAEGPRYVCEWMEASLMNRWLLKTRLADALQAHGEGSHWVETRDKPPVREMAARPSEAPPGHASPPP